MCRVGSLVVCLYRGLCFGLWIYDCVWVGSGCLVGLVLLYCGFRFVSLMFGFLLLSEVGFELWCGFGGFLWLFDFLGYCLFVCLVLC